MRTRSLAEKGFTWEKTELVLTHEGLNTEAVRALVEGGWPSLLDALASVLSSPLLDL